MQAVGPGGGQGTRVPGGIGFRRGGGLGILSSGRQYDPGVHSWKEAEAVPTLKAVFTERHGMPFILLDELTGTPSGRDTAFR